MNSKEDDNNQDNEFDKAMAASMVEVTSFFNQDKPIWEQTEIFSKYDDGTNIQRHEIHKLTEDVLEAGIEP